MFPAIDVRARRMLTAQFTTKILCMMELVKFLYPLDPIFGTNRPTDFFDEAVVRKQIIVVGKVSTHLESLNK